MKIRLLPGLFALTLTVASFASPLLAEEKDSLKKPDLKIDAAPLNGGVVTSYADVVEPAQKSVVSVYSKRIVRERVGFDPFTGRVVGGEHEEDGLGSGVIVSSDGYILTNNHVVEGADELKVSLSDDRELVAKVIGTDPKTDIAVIKIDTKNLPAITLADSDKTRVGDIVFALGNPLGVGQTVTMGIVSAKGRTQLGLLDQVGGYESFIQTDASINMGNSGGALIDAKGRLVGINSAILSPSKGNIGIGFAVPVNLAASIMRSLIETGTVARGFLGVSTDTITSELAEQMGLPKETKGVLLSDISPDSPAAKAGLKRNDAILSIDGRAVTSREELRLIVAQNLPGSKVKLRLVRDGKERTVEVVLGKLVENPNELLAGVQAEPLTEESRRQLDIDKRVTGLLVTKVADDSPYHDRLAPNAVIVEIDREPAGDLRTAKAALQPGRHLLLIYFRGQLRYLTFLVK
ncbi:MAG: Do family serine endopeptidase [Verrucomicrobia bacterium]|nr:Do family serine endopeptidase [Verrucomicrobiota bacterium]